VTGGREFDKTHVHKLLTSPVYIGKVCYKTEVHEGEHDAIIDPDVYEKVQQILKGNATTCGLENRNKHKALLRGLLRCETCNCAMSHSFTTQGKKVYRYWCQGFVTQICHTQNHSKTTKFRIFAIVLT
jgi:site-specific DNA recombinase